MPYLPALQNDEILWMDLCDADFQAALSDLLAEFDTLQQQWEDLTTVFASDNWAAINVADFQINLAFFSGCLTRNSNTR